MAAISVWFEKLDVGDAAVARSADMLHIDERARAAAFRFDHDRRRFIVRRARMREILGVHLCESPERLVFVDGTFGKPELVGAEVRFSLSHSRQAMMLAIADVAVGCDIEWIDPALDWRPIAARLFAPGEWAALAALGEPAGSQGFFDCWVRKEAFVKALGKGLSYPLDAFEVSVGEDARLLDGGAGWSMCGGRFRHALGGSFGSASGFAFAIVACGEELPEIEWAGAQAGLAPTRRKSERLSYRSPRSRG